METDRLILRTYKTQDLQDYYEYVSNPEVVKFEPYKPMTIEQAEKDLHYRIKSDEFIAVELKENHKMIGNVYLGKRDFNTLEIGFVFNLKYQKNGYATEACKALIEKSFSEGIHRIYAECDPDNIRSWHLLERLGFIREGHLIKNIYFWTDELNQPIWKDTFIYSLLNNQISLIKTA